MCVSNVTLVISYVMFIVTNGENITVEPVIVYITRYIYTRHRRLEFSNKYSAVDTLLVTSLRSHQFQIFLYYLVSKFIISIKLLCKFINPLILKEN